MRSACMDMLYAAGQKLPAFSGYIYNMNRTPPPYIISHNYTDWYDVQLFGIPAYGTGQVSYSFTPILLQLSMVLLYYIYGVYARWENVLAGLMITRYNKTEKGIAPTNGCSQLDVIANSWELLVVISFVTKVPIRYEAV